MESNKNGYRQEDLGEFLLCCERNEKVMRAIETTREKTVIYRDLNHKIKERENYSFRMIVETKEVLETVRIFSEKYPNERIGIVNCLGKSNPFVNLLYEEDGMTRFGRVTTWYPCMNTENLKKNYKFTSGKGDDNEDICIYTPDILIVRNNSKDLKLLDEKDWIPVDVINYLKKEGKDIFEGEEEKINYEEIKEKVLYIAEVHKMDIVILVDF